MKPNITFSIVLFLVSSKLLCQELRVFNGRIIVRDAMVKGVMILNLNSERETFSNDKGEFQILANPGDLLIFHAAHLEKYRRTVSLQDFETAYVSISMVSKVEQLAEVEVVSQKIDAVSAGILSAPAKRYTPAERRLKTAGDFKPIHLLGLLGGSLPLDPILNAINGRTKRLKKEVAVEHRELVLKEINNRYDDLFFNETLGIPKEHVGGFKYFLAENTGFEPVLNTKNETKILFEMSLLATQYLSIQND